MRCKIKMILFNLIKQYNNWALKECKSNSSFKISIDTIISFIAITPIIGFLCRWYFFSSFGIDYFIYFNISDSIVSLYKIGTPLILITLLLMPLFGLLIPVFFKEVKLWKIHTSKNETIVIFFLTITILESIIFFIYFNWFNENIPFSFFLIVILSFTNTNLFILLGFKNVGILLYIIYNNIHPNGLFSELN